MKSFSYHTSKFGLRFATLFFFSRFQKLQKNLLRMCIRLMNAYRHRATPLMSRKWETFNKSLKARCLQLENENYRYVPSR